VKTHRKRNRLFVVLLGCGAASLLAACSEDSGTAPGLGDSGADSAGPAGPLTLFDFATSSQGWYYNGYQAMADGGPADLLNLASSSVTITGARPTIEWDATVGNPAPGSLKLVIPFTGFDQNVIANVQFKPAVDWTDKVVSLDIKIEPGFEELYTGGLQFLAQDSSWAGTWQWKNWPFDNGWYTYELDMTMAAMKTEDVVQFGFQVISGTPAGAPVDDQGNPVFTPTTVTLYVDNVVVQ
jgi:hypothetical protein